MFKTFYLYKFYLTIQSPMGWDSWLTSFSLLVSSSDSIFHMGWITKLACRDDLWGANWSLGDRRGGLHSTGVGWLIQGPWSTWKIGLTFLASWRLTKIPVCSVKSHPLRLAKKIEVGQWKPPPWGLVICSDKVDHKKDMLLIWKIISSLGWWCLIPWDLLQDTFSNYWKNLLSCRLQIF